jgi:hypothetical protein
VGNEKAGKFTARKALSMSDEKDKKSFSEFQFPQLNRFNAKKFSAELLSDTGGRKLQSRFVDTFQFLLESAPDGVAESLSPIDRLRVSVVLGLEGYWRDKESAFEVATFKGTYRAIFNFSMEVEEEQLQMQMRQDSFRNFLAVQVYPIAKNHMFSQIGMLGINVNRRLGLDIYAQQEVLGETPKKRRAQRR